MMFESVFKVYLLTTIFNWRLKSKKTHKNLEIARG